MLKPGAWQEEKFRIESKASLETVLNYIDENEEDLEALQVLYVYPEDTSPQSSPAKTLLLNNEEFGKEESRSGTSHSKTSERSSNQSRFAIELHRRDKVCLLCGETNSLEGAHIVDASAKLSEVEMNYLGLSTKYEFFNGILLCCNCHCKYDKWIYGIDKDGFLWEKINGKWTKNEKKNIFSSKDERNSRRYPCSRTLEWKFQRFLLNRDKLLSRIMYSFSSLSMSLTPPKNNKGGKKKIKVGKGKGSLL
jgi:5-methylcytosine-specific restriction endonuclease McrA